MNQPTDAARIRIGTSGWYYDHWEAVLYPPKLPKAKRFAAYAEHFDTVEVNATFYRLPSASMAEGWHRQAPPGFLFVAKASKRITHNHKLADAAEPLAQFLRAVEPLGEKLAVVLFQLPPSLHQDLARLEDFLALLPPAPRAAFEFRHPSWESDATFDLLRRHRAIHCVVSSPDYPFAEAHTADIAYYRMHGTDRRYASSYSDEWLADLARKLVALARGGTTCFAFFNNDAEGHAVRNADTLRRCTQSGL
jgi:uncharacterized protein YecE (DUF72 family)